MANEAACADCGIDLNDKEGRNGLCDECADKRENVNTVRDWHEGLDDPDNIGQSEYRCIHELLGDIVESTDTASEAENFKHMDAVLDEVIGWAKKLKGELKKYVKAHKRKKRR